MNEVESVIIMEMELTHRRLETWFFCHS